jgi:LEA14-like dessication related protein
LIPKGEFHRMKRAKKIFLFGLLFLLLSCASWFFEKPTFALKEIVVKRISFGEINFLFGIEVQNPNRFDLKLREFEYKAYIEDQEVGSGRLEKEVRIAPSSSTLVQVPLQSDLSKLGNSLGLVLLGKDLRYKIEGAAVIKTRLGTSTIPFSKTGEIKLTK